MRINPQFVSANIASQAVLVSTNDVDFHGIVRGNKTFGAIVELLQEDISEEELIAAMYERFDAPEGTIEPGVAYVLSELRKVGALEE